MTVYFSHMILETSPSRFSHEKLGGTGDEATMCIHISSHGTRCNLLVMEHILTPSTCTCIV